MARRSWFVVATAVLWFGGLFGSASLTGCGPSLSLYQEGVQALREKQYAEAIELFSEELEDNPESHLALVNRADAYFETQQLEQAVRDYTRAIELLERRNRPNPWFHNRRGLAYYQLGRYTEAVEDWTRAKALEAQRRAAGIKVRRSPAYLQVSARRDALLFDAERQAARTPAYAVAQPHTPAPIPPGATPQAPEAGQPEKPAAEEGEVVVAEQPAAGTSEPSPTASETPAPQVAAMGPEHDLAIEQARMAHEAAALEWEAQQQALLEVQRRAEEERQRQLALQRRRERERRARERAAQEEAAIAQARAEHQSRAEALAREAMRIHPIANLSGTWIRDDDYTFSLLDDGRRVVGTITDTEDFVFYEITLEWTGDDTLTGFAVLKENLSPCHFETSTAWSLQVHKDGTLIGNIEEVGWNAECQENERTWGSYTFQRAN